MTPRFETIVAFVRVAETGSFSEAARRLGLSKSMISRQVSALEADLGVRLLHRTTRSLSPTEAGRAYLERCQRILADLDEANLLVSHLQAVPRGRLRVSAPLSFGIGHLSACLPGFLERYPEIELEMGFTDRHVDLVEEGWDVAVRIGRLADSSLIVRRLAPVRRLAAASPAYLERRGAPTRPEELAAHDCLTHGNAVHSEWRFVGDDGKPLQVEVGGRFHADNGDVLRDMALAGMGIVLLPSFFLGDDIRAGTLVPLLERYVPLDSSLNAVYPHGRHLSPKVRAFVDHLAGTFGPEPYWDRGITGPAAT
ncbi:Transcriptional regulator(Winged helix-turn-helix transcription repressor DNA-binding,6-286) [Magnetospirillum sp. XM-1]|uniref:LysR family transcriptional regulator n=1 Tax=Magnetospirillum sp. XM-1 TaxID=1663591 RepID=UPI00073DE601|nr:LysR family transcriptional regulator [Magnetospirillum sp. XM-1]CUW38183.1 Transcriptional regulator(Winged helix-turn-helix transcription repressor DNA-binding,6-286) [Magnetospirillum sp. XM-1]